MERPRIEIVPVRLEKHPDADTLSIAYVKGWQCIVKTEEFDGVELGAYIPLDTVLPQSDEWRYLEQYKYRVRTIRLRGILSQGLLIPARRGWELGDDVAEELEAQKYDPPIPVHLGGTQASPIPGFMIYPRIKNWKDYPEVFIPGDLVYVTEKIHGTNARYGMIGGQYCIGTHRTCRKLDSSCVYASIGKDFMIEDILKQAQEVLIKEFHPAMITGAENVIIYGEIFGKSIQDLKYGRQQPDFRVFDIFADGRFLSYYPLEATVKKLGLEMVPIFYEGPYESQYLDDWVNGEAFSGGHTREGVVIASLSEKTHPKLGRLMLKYKSDAYELRKGGSEHH